MNKNLTSLTPSALWENFQSLTQIPRPSKKEAAIIEFVKNFGNNLGLETIVDEVGNVIIRKPATIGFEKKKGVILQSHLDMVPQKNTDKKHDFEKDPIEAYIDGDWVTANDTTLGADNGIGVAAILSVLASDKIQHGPIEALLTIDEETGMTGAFELKPNMLNGEILLNLDSEDEGELYVGCAGGIDTTAVFNYTKMEVPEASTAFAIAITGLKGGHSGLDINLNRGNANKILNKILINGNEHNGLLLADINGGSLRNAIPREAFATVVIPNDQIPQFKELVDEILEYYKQRLSDGDGLRISIAETAKPGQVIDVETLDNLLNALHFVPNGVVKMSDDFEGVVETSTNLAIVKSSGEEINVALLHRSSSEEAKSELCEKVKAVFEKYKAQVEHSGDYPGWQPNANSPILGAMKKTYNELYGVVPEVKVIHAGLECGILGSKYPNWDMISFGPTIRFPHSPDEKVNIQSVAKFWDYLIKTLENIPEK